MVVLSHVLVEQQESINATQRKIGVYSSLHGLWPLTLMEKLSMWTSEWMKEEGTSQISVPPSIPFLPCPSIPSRSNLLRGSNSHITETLTPPTLTDDGCIQYYCNVHRSWVDARKECLAAMHGSRSGSNVRYYLTWTHSPLEERNEQGCHNA
jgi:hypothetical protein